MALSNWDTLAVDLDGQPSDGTFTDPSGMSVSIYKNWVYVRHLAAWAALRGFSEPTFSDIWHGDIRLGYTRILAKRGATKESILVAVYYTANQDQVDGEPYRQPIVTGMVGIGCYGFAPCAKWVGVEQAEVDELQAWLMDLQERGDIRVVPDLARAVRFNQGDAYFATRTGVAEMMQPTAPGEAAPTILSQIAERMS